MLDTEDSPPYPLPRVRSLRPMWIKGHSVRVCLEPLPRTTTGSGPGAGAEGRNHTAQRRLDAPDPLTGSHSCCQGVVASQESYLTAAKHKDQSLVVPTGWWLHLPFQRNTSRSKSNRSSSNWSSREVPTCFYVERLVELEQLAPQLSWPSCRPAGR